VNGGFTRKDGLDSAGWRRTRVDGRVTFGSGVDAPNGTVVGRIRVPIFAEEKRTGLVRMNGGLIKRALDEGHAWVGNVQGGKIHHVTL
jgi:hypothetical protein